MNAKLQKHIGVKELLAYYISSVVGAGVLIIPGVAAQIAGQNGDSCSRQWRGTFLCGANI